LSKYVAGGLIEKVHNVVHTSRVDIH